MGDTINFRRVDYPFTDPGVERWQIEFFDTQAAGGIMFPIGMAWVVVFSGRQAAQLNFILVADEWRRRGIGRKIIHACIARWPDMQFTGAMSKSGKRLIQKFIAP